MHPRGQGHLMQNQRNENQMLIDPSLIKRDFLLNAGGVSFGSSCRSEVSFCHVGVAKMPTAEIRHALTSQPHPTVPEIASMGRAKKFIPFRGSEIGLYESENGWLSVIRREKAGGRRHYTTVVSTVSHNVKDMGNSNLLSVGIKNPRSKLNALLIAMVEITENHVINQLGKTWKPGYIDFPLNWDWLCAPDQVLPLTDESSFEDFEDEVPEIALPDFVDGVWLSQPLEATFSPTIEGSDHQSVLNEIHQLRNNPDSDSLLFGSYSGGFLNVGCYDEVHLHPVLSKLHPKLQHIIRQVCVISCVRYQMVDLLIPYLALARPQSPQCPF